MTAVEELQALVDIEKRDNALLSIHFFADENATEEQIAKDALAMLRDYEAGLGTDITDEEI